MAGALTHRNAPPNATFSQQGQVDWVGLANHSVSFTVGVLSRLSKAGVDPLTVVRGRALFCNMQLSPLGQQRVFDALSALKSFSSFGQLIWLGFGVRHIVHELTGTEGGMTCVALSAALQVSYDSLFGAQVFQELSRRHGAPDNLLPSLHQWRALLHVSTGVLTTSKFPRLLDGFARILAPPRADSTLPQRYATTPSVIAQALCLLSDAANGRTASCTFAGGIDCAWVAAVAEWLYCLPVEILSEDSSETHYRSSPDGPSSSRSPRVLIIKCDDASSPVSALSKTFIIPSGGELIMEKYQNNPQDLSRSCFVRRSEWAHLLTDVFGKAIENLLQGQTGESFAYLLRHAINIGLIEASDHRISGNLLNSDNETFFEFAGTRLPELKSCLDRPAVRHDHRPWAKAIARRSMTMIRNACECPSCRDASDYRLPTSNEGPICLRRLAVTVLSLLHILYNVAVDPDITPLHYNIFHMYENVISREYCDSSSLLSKILTESSPSTVMGIFARGGPDVNRLYSGQYSALSMEGLCAYYHLLQDPNLSPKDAVRIHLLPGCIEHNEIQYRVVEDPQQPHDSERPFWSGFVTRPTDRIDFIVQETAHSDKISGTYRIHPNASDVRNSIIPYSYCFAVCEVIACAKILQQTRCLGSDCVDSGMIMMADESGSPTKNTAEINGEGKPEEQPNSSKLPVPGEQRDLAFEDRRTVSLSLLVSEFVLINANTKEQELKIHKFPVFSGIDKRGNSSTSVNFARLYAEAVLARRDRRRPISRIAVLGKFDDCALCLIEFANFRLRRQLLKWKLSRLLQKDVPGIIIHYLANGEERSRNTFMLKQAVDEAARGPSLEPDSSAPWTRAAAAMIIEARSTEGRRRRRRRSI
jgi:hypothetical protein